MLIINIPVRKPSPRLKTRNTCTAQPQGHAVGHIKERQERGSHVEEAQHEALDCLCR